MALFGLLKEVRKASGDTRPLAVGGARELAAVLRKELGQGGAPGAIRADGTPEDAAALVYVLAREPSDADEEALKRAHRARVPVVCVLAGPARDDLRVPYVLATDIIRVGAGAGFPLEAIAAALAARLDERGPPLAARLPVLRRAVCERLIASFSRKNGILGAAIFVPGADLPVLTLNQARLVLGIAAAHGETIDRERLPELLGVVGAGFGLRAVAAQALDLVPVAGWAVKGAIAYSGTRAVGEAALRWFDARVPA